MSDTQPIEGQEQPTAEAERDALLSLIPNWYMPIPPLPPAPQETTP
jgi:hypothetical protein